MNGNLGSFGITSPDGMQAVRNALARRQQGGGGTPALDTQSAISPTASPLAPQPAGGVPLAGAPPMPTAPTQPKPKPSEAEIILEAMSSRLKSENKLRESRIPQTV